MYYACASAGQRPEGPVCALVARHCMPCAFTVCEVWYVSCMRLRWAVVSKVCQVRWRHVTACTARGSMWHVLGWHLTTSCRVLTTNAPRCALAWWVAAAPMCHAHAGRVSNAGPASPGAVYAAWAAPHMCAWAALACAGAVLTCHAGRAQEVHVKNRCAWLNHSSNAGAFISLVHRYPNIRLWFSGAQAARFSGIRLGWGG